MRRKNVCCEPLLADSSVTTGHWLDLDLVYSTEPGWRPGISPCSPYSHRDFRRRTHFCRAWMMHTFRQLPADHCCPHRGFPHPANPVWFYPEEVSAFFLWVEASFIYTGPVPEDNAGGYACQQRYACQGWAPCKSGGAQIIHTMKRFIRVGSINRQINPLLSWPGFRADNCCLTIQAYISVHHFLFLFTCGLLGSRGRFGAVYFFLTS